MSGEMKFKEGVETATSDFWYDLFEGGYLTPSNMVADEDLGKKLDEARKLLMAYKRELYDQEIVEDM